MGEELKKYRLTIPEVTKIALLLRKKGIDVPMDVLNEQELVDAIMQQKAS